MKKNGECALCTPPETTTVNSPSFFSKSSSLSLPPPSPFLPFPPLPSPPPPLVSGTVFAYSQTSSGETFTKMGTDNQCGIIPRSIQEMLSLCTLRRYCTWHSLCTCNFKYVFSLIVDNWLVDYSFVCMGSVVCVMYVLI